MFGGVCCRPRALRNRLKTTTSFVNGGDHDGHIRAERERDDQGQYQCR